ncbi:unnamed protein product [Peronospora belbahrii]|uniref:RanBP2-type domain-containing protein n=1 Tax=Peronospora belbahrii TaxID=622444 RepID=A0ABN8D840_9STRA|nr:unnamed protein product [Peronospora belbahrii]
MATSRSPSSSEVTRRHGNRSRRDGRHVSKQDRKSDDRRLTHKKRQRSRSRSIHNEEKTHKKHSKKDKKHYKTKREITPQEAASAKVAANSTCDPMHVEDGEKIADEEREKRLSLETKSMDATSFFEQLEKQEAAKRPVGTVHSRGLPPPLSATAISVCDKWECSKAGCGQMNSKHAPSCNKCGAMKRMSEWR